jgi:hypothetical protein
VAQLNCLTTAHVVRFARKRNAWHDWHMWFLWSLSVLIGIAIFASLVSTAGMVWIIKTGKTDKVPRYVLSQFGEKMVD